VIILHEIHCSNTWFIIYEILSRKNYFIANFAETSNHISWDTLQKHLIIFHEILCTNIWLYLTLILLMWRIWWAPNNASKWQMGFNSAFKVLMRYFAETSDHISWNILQEHLLIFNEILRRNIWLYLIRYFADTSDYI